MLVNTRPLLLQRLIPCLGILLQLLHVVPLLLDRLIELVQSVVSGLNLLLVELVLFEVALEVFGELLGTLLVVRVVQFELIVDLKDLLL
jgi:hypothetical protein